MERNESIKLLFDFFKHITTLDIACILLMAGLIGKVFPKDISLKDIELMFSSFVFSLLCCLAAMVSLIYISVKMREIKNKTRIYITILILSLIGFLMGLSIAGDLMLDYQQKVQKQDVIKVALLECNKCFFYPCTD